ncbi:MAG TPA: Stp1/IreP family PP2C-type Ser/Thr phosphatase [Blastocatellia bacterium]|nr:Stp1/IreP family PP2C-type Ser/Thr phosphatase [Blastocatellia bacterium]
MCYPNFPFLMDERLRQIDSPCPSCGAVDNDPDATFCEGCGWKLGSALVQPLPPPEPCEPGKPIASRFTVRALLWTAPTYNAYEAVTLGSPETFHTIIEQRLTPGDPLAGLSPVGVSLDGSDTRPRVSGSLEDAAAAFERFGLFKPVEHTIEGENRYIVFEHIKGQVMAHLDQTDEKEARALGLQLCALAEQFHRHGWVYNGFEPYGIVLDQEGRLRLIGFDRARQARSAVDENPIYPSREYTAPDLFAEDAVYDVRSDVYSIGSLLQYLLSGESISEGAGFYPLATVFPNFERLIARAVSDDPDERFQSVTALREALEQLSLPVVLQAGHFTDVGLVRELNEDSILALNLTQYFESVQTQIGVYIVSDGMGGEAAGEVASRVTVRAVAEWVTDKLISASLKSTREEKIAAPTQTGGLRLAIADGYEMATTEMLKQAVVSANREVMAYAKANPDERGLGATATVAMVVGDVLTIAHVGDSRCYLLSGDRFEQLTEDHSLVQRMVNTGNLSRSEAKIHPYRNVIYRSIGADETIEIDIIRRKLTSGDVLVLCSDGLNGMLSDDQICDVLMVNQDPNTAAKELVVAANAAGGEDNTSVIVVRIS